MSWTTRQLKPIHRLSSAVVFVISLPMLLLALIYAGETVFWSEGPATDYPLFHTPRPSLPIRIHGLLCLLSATGLTCTCAMGMNKSHGSETKRRRLDLIIHSSCLICIWWNPWSTGTMEKEEFLVRSALSIPSFWLILLTALASQPDREKSIDTSNNASDSHDHHP